jgi:hypothetical protein
MGNNPSLKRGGLLFISLSNWYNCVKGTGIAENAVKKSLKRGALRTKHSRSTI